MDALVRPLPAKQDSDEGVQVTFFNALLGSSKQRLVATVGRLARQEEFVLKQLHVRAIRDHAPHEVRVFFRLDAACRIDDSTMRGEAFDGRCE